MFGFLFPSFLPWEHYRLPSEICLYPTFLFGFLVTYVICGRRPLPIVFNHRVLRRFFLLDRYADHGTVFFHLFKSVTRRFPDFRWFILSFSFCVLPQHCPCFRPYTQRSLVVERCRRFLYGESDVPREGLTVRGHVSHRGIRGISFVRVRPCRCAVQGVYRLSLGRVFIYQGYYFPIKYAVARRRRRRHRWGQGGCVFSRVCLFVMCAKLRYFPRCLARH